MLRLLLCLFASADQNRALSVHSKEPGSDRISAEDEAGEKTRNADKYQSHMRATPPNGMLIFIKIASPASL
ncbi:hypothetical protein ACLKA7_004001 [Drosophila subpalustris]